MYKVIKLISKKLYNKNVPSFMKAHVHWMNNEKPNQTKNSKSLNFAGKGCKAKDSF
jgi:hypothetical protein